MAERRVIDCLGGGWDEKNKTPVPHEKWTKIFEKFNGNNNKRKWQLKKAKGGVIECLGGGWDEKQNFCGLKGGPVLDED